MHLNHIILLMICFPVAVTACKADSYHPNPDQLIILGDSYSDPGNVFQKTDGQVPVNPPYYNSRFSNGPVWADKVKTEYTLSENGYHNLAYGGANTDSTNAISQMISPQAPEPYSSVRKEVRYSGVLQQVEELRQKPVRPKQTGWVVIWSGSNDYSLDSLVTDAKVHTVMDDMAMAVSRLEGMGWHNIIVFNLNEDVSTPELAADSAGRSVYYSLAKKHNALLRRYIPQWGKEFGVNIHLFDLAALFQNIAANPQSFGFTDIRSACYYGGSSGFFKFTGKVENCKGRLYWDDIGHFTAGAHRVIARRFQRFMKQVE